MTIDSLRMSNFERKTIETAANQKNYKNDVTNTQYVIVGVYTDWVSPEVSKFGLAGWLCPYIIIKVFKDSTTKPNPLPILGN